MYREGGLINEREFSKIKRSPGLNVPRRALDGSPDGRPDGPPDGAQTPDAIAKFIHELEAASQKNLKKSIIGADVFFFSFFLAKINFFSGNIIF